MRVRGALARVSCAAVARRGGAAGLALLLVACAPAANVAQRPRGEPAGPAHAAVDRAPAPSASPTREEAERLLAREAAPMVQRTVTSANGVIQGAIEATAPPLVREAPPEAMSTLVAQIGGAAPIECRATRRSRAPGWTLGTTMTALRERGRAVDGVAFVDVTVVGGHPAIFAEIGYREDGRAGPSKGVLKIAILATGEGTIACSHDELGFRRSFARVVGGFLASAVRGERVVEGELHTVDVTRIDGRPVATIERWARATPEGGLAEDYLSTWVWWANGAPEAVDVVETETTDKEGALVKNTYGRARNGDVYVRQETTRVGKDTYQVKGTREGKPLDATFTAPGLTSTAAQRRALAAAAARAGATAAFAIYRPFDDPRGASTIRWTARADAALEREEGGVQSVVRLDPEGLPETSTARRPDGRDVVGARVFSEGRLP